MVQINLRLSVTVDEFYDDDVQTSFVNRICAFLGISTDRLKIVGIRESSLRRILSSSADTTITLEIQSENTCIGCESYSAYSEYYALKNISQTLN